MDHLNQNRLVFRVCPEIGGRSGLGIMGDINRLAWGLCLHTAGVAGSIPAAPTIQTADKSATYGLSAADEDRGRMARVGKVRL